MPFVQHDPLNYIFEMAYPAILMGGHLPWIVEPEYLSCLRQICADEPSLLGARTYDDSEAQHIERYHRLYQPFLDTCEEQEVAMEHPNNKICVYWRRDEGGTSHETKEC